MGCRVDLAVVRTDEVQNLRIGKGASAIAAHSLKGLALESRTRGNWQCEERRNYRAKVPVVNHR
jgi:hypothetical protein